MCKVVANQSEMYSGLDTHETGGPAQFTRGEGKIKIRFFQGLFSKSTFLNITIMEITLTFKK